ncbi:putative Response regulator receiver, diguanylate cyclase (GGDEF domain) (plasmid) [Cupriavidus taiwanensis]|uniref:diguanylate cyclase n=2 Tax=Cupriavidus taiwanensis TaxID=164546 RepID=A0A375I6W0_9BURK|nr:Response regulator receiver, putative diguanylate cyclase (GGDEF domain) [Cupriavidus taiwanensis]SPA32596.1 Response regulator receiver, putative diguanylate cyclase (GGDEF domain) [Cupriavidus taiwanensis]SPA51858.1 Response regulator receiver, putative diguanylate cyclase (GGDEF domain) [Cupriavidus taiwanensis]SPK70367.1 putative Response regulator receiver, diguanylate cyclase (GGDEF domain) [Cupriavidus taiwanensis]SPK76951.1 putative Response regulator receiver, diguanylate cyclase (G
MQPESSNAAGMPARTPATDKQEYLAMVLLVDDQAMVGEAVRRALATEPDIDFHYCSQPDEAVAVAQRTKPTVILQDLVMPGVDGLTLVQRYRDNPATRDIPIIVLSTKEEAATKGAAFAAGANDYLVKLPDSIELIARIRYHSRSYVNQLQRDEAYRALRQSQQQLLETNLELQRLTNSDGLTGLSNRRYFDEYLGAEWRRALREQTQVALLMIDVDAFKAYNDTYGHVAGDEVLRRVATVIRDNCVRATDLPARFGGEEFAMVLPATSPGGVRLLAEKVRRAVQGLAIAHSGSPTLDCVTVSIGGAVLVPQPGTQPSELVEAADAGLYQAKRNGRNQVMMSPG